MADQQKRQDQDRTPRPLDDIRKVKDPAERARLAVEFTAYAEARAKAGRDVRDAALRDLKAAGVSIPEVARRTGVNVNTVKVVVR